MNRSSSHKSQRKKSSSRPKTSSKSKIKSSHYSSLSSLTSLARAPTSSRSPFSTSTKISRPLSSANDEIDPWVKTKTWAIGQKELIPGYRYALRHTRLLPSAERANSKSEIRSLFRSLTIEDSDINKSRYLPNLWSRLSFFRMSIPRHKRPPLPPNLTNAAKELGMSEGSGYFVATPLRGDDGITIIEKTQPSIQSKAKLYNMDLHPADIARHHALNERFHFRGPERFK